MNNYFKISNTKKKAFLIILLLFWSGAIRFGSIFYNLIGNPMGLETKVLAFKWLNFDEVFVHFAPTFDALRGAFQHVIQPFIACCIFLENKNNYNIYIFMALPLMFSATFGFIYFVLILLSYAIIQFVRTENKLNVIKLIFGKENLLMLPITLVLLIYLMGNLTGEKPEGMGFSIINPFEHILFFSIFIIFEFLIYFILLFKRNHKDPIYWICLVELFVITFLSLGLYNDLCSRGSILARFFIMVFFVGQIFLYDYKEWRNILLAIFLGIAMLNSVDQIRGITETTLNSYNPKYIIMEQSYVSNNYNSFKGYAANPNERVDNAYNYYTFDYSKSLFKILSKLIMLSCINITDTCSSLLHSHTKILKTNL